MVLNMKNEKITIFCSGGCGRSITLRASKVLKCDFYVCSSKTDGQQCAQSLPRDPNKHVRIEFNAAASFTGYTEFSPDAEDRAAVARANRILRVALGKQDKANLSAA